MHTYPLDILGTLRPAIDERIARAAASAYGENGVSLYDEVKNTSRDDDIIQDMIYRSKDDVLARLWDVAKPSATDTIDFNLPDLPSTTDLLLDEAVDVYIINNVCAQWFQQKRPVLVPEYTAAAQAALDRLVILVRTRKDPLS